MATVCHTDEETRGSPSQVSTKTARNFVEGQSENDDIRKKTGLRKLEDIIKERRLRWLGHVLRMEDSRTLQQAMQWELKGYKRKPGRPRVNWMDIVKRNLKSTGISWEEAGELAADRTEWRQRVAQCIYDAG